jgi:flagellar biosynthesis/type III secretory pathway M-ring protein FliF/YscJ
VAAAAGIQDDRADSLEVSAAPFPKPDDIQAEEEPEATGGIMDLVPTIVGSVLLLVVALWVVGVVILELVLCRPGRRHLLRARLRPFPVPGHDERRDPTRRAPARGDRHLAPIVAGRPPRYAGRVI